MNGASASRILHLKGVASVCPSRDSCRIGHYLLIASFYFWNMSNDQPNISASVNRLLFALCFYSSICIKNRKYSAKHFQTQKLTHYKPPKCTIFNSKMQKNVRREGTSHPRTILPQRLRRLILAPLATPHGMGTVKLYCCPKAERGHITLCTACKALALYGFCWCAQCTLTSFQDLLSVSVRTVLVKFCVVLLFYTCDVLLTASCG